MADFELTPSQKKAVEAPVMDLLVSAAAGSGKTAVLSRRIVKILSDENTGADVSRLLVVTFTKAAASELRVRIADALSEEIISMRAQGNEAGAERLSGQLRRLGLASISTIHSFCYRLVRENFSRLSLPASVRIAEEAETQSLMRACMDSAIDELYEKDDGFSAFADTLIELRDDKLSDILLEFYLRLIQQPDGLGFAERSRKMLADAAEDFDSSRFFVAIKNHVSKFAAYYETALARAIDDILKDEKAKKAYYNAFYSDLVYVRGIVPASEEGYASLSRYLRSYSPERLGALRAEKSEPILFASDMRKAFSQGVRTLEKRFARYSAADIKNDCLFTAAYADKLYEALSFFDKIYSAEKLKNSVVDYNDLERLSYRLLYDGDKPSRFAASVAAKFDAVFIDEYQDTNALQDAIFAAVSSSNRFMVGDIKQSIYGFRGAMPGIFSEYRNRYPDYDGGSGCRQGKIFLSENFRSDKGVVDFSNRIFARLFNNNSGRVPYMPDDALVCSRPPERDAGLSTQLLFLEKSDEKCMSEADYVASRINSLILNGVQPSDIVILLRSMSASEKFRKALSSYDVRCDCPGREDSLLSYPEILLMICMVNVIDNPCRDIYTAGVLKSPLFDVSTGELITLRREYPKGSLYSALKEFYASDRRDEQSIDLMERAGKFFRWLEQARRYSEMKPSDKIVRYLMTETPVIAIAVKNGGSAERIRQFYELARKYEAYFYHGLHSFVRYINQLSERKPSEQPQALTRSETSSVRIMSIHQSKGSEFSYVFLADTSRRFNNADRTGKLLYESSLGIGMKHRDDDGYVRYDTLIRQAVSSAIQLDNLDEEMRILYVALTRAKKQLIITASVGKPDEFRARCRYFGKEMTPWLCMEASSYAEWLALCLAEDDGEASTISGYEKESVHADTSAPDNNDAQREHTAAGRVLAERLDFEYPSKDLADLPAKLSVSRLYPGILDDDGAELIRAQENEFDRTPAFLGEKIAASGAERGTATHLFMQFCNFDSVVTTGIEAEIKRLVEKKFITPEAARLIYRKKLAAFFDGAVFEMVKNAARIKREQRFNVRMDAGVFTLDPVRAAALSGETILVQGVIDLLIFERDGNIILVDYKTDHIPAPEGESGAGYREFAENFLRERYSAQIIYYARAVEKLYSKKVKRALLYSFSLGDTVDIEV